MAGRLFAPSTPGVTERHDVYVLHIDDDADTRMLVKELLVEGGEAFFWVGAGGVREAIAQYIDMRPDAVLLDNRLGPETGLELVPSIREVWDCPIWILTGFAPEALESENTSVRIIAKDELLANPQKLRDLLLSC